MFLHFKQLGKGKPLILLHGLFGSLSNLGVFARAFQDQFCVYQIDLPNHGLSPHADEVNYRYQAEQVYQLIQQENLDEITLIGHSMGGKVAMMLALTYPQIIDKLIVLDIAPVTYLHHQHDAIFTGLRSVIKAKCRTRKMADEVLAQHVTSQAVRQFLLVSLYKTEDGAMDWRFNWPVLEQRYRDITSFDADGNKRFDNPVLFIKGADSDYIQAANKPIINQYFPGAKAHIIANAGHELHQQQPMAVLRVTQAFLTATQNPRGAEN